MVTAANRELVELQVALTSPGGTCFLEDRCLDSLRAAFNPHKSPGASLAGGLTPGGCSALISEIGTGVDRAAAAVG